jgi:pteridine reductase
MDLHGKVAIVTGAGRRVGREIALALAGRGMSVAVHFGKSRAEAESVTAEIAGRGGHAAAFQADLRSVAEIRQMVDRVVSLWGGVDLIVNSASVFYRKTLDEVTEDDWDLNLDVNLKAPFFLAKFAAETMRQRGGGKIVNIGDWAGIRPYTNYLPYTVSKSGLIGLTRALARALAPAIQVNCIALGPVLPPEDYSATEIERLRRSTLTGTLGTPADVVAAVLFLCEGTDFATGSTLLLDGGRLLA